MDKNRKSALRKLVVGTDAVVVAAAGIVAFFAHAALRDFVPWLKAPPTFEEYALVAVLAVPLWVALIAMFRLDRALERVYARRELLVRLAKVHLAGVLGLAALLFVTASALNRSLVAVFLACSFTLLYTERALLGRWLRFQYERGHRRERLLLVGAPSAVLDTLLGAAGASGLPPAIVGRVGPDGPADAATSAAVRHLGDLDRLSSVLHDEAVDRVLCFPPYSEPRTALDVLEACETLGLPVGFAVDLSPLRRARPTVEQLFGGTFVSYELSPKSPEALALKHAIDAVAAAALLVALAPLLLLTALAVLVTMGRPVFFSQERAGLRGRTFRMWKFRTMVADAEARQAELAGQNEMSGPVFKVTRDPRVTRLGSFLRKTSIDELPQLLNVLLGTMSLVGPRPLPVREQREIRGWHRRRLSMRPGITCLWQIGGRNDIDFEGWMKLDLEYVDRWSIGLDLLILLKTVPVVLLRKGAR